MDNPSSPGQLTGPKFRLLLYAAAGLEAGMAGVIWMFGCFFVAAFWNGRGIWSVPNLFATVFYGDVAYQDGFYRTTWAGLALIVVLYGLLGAVWGCVWKERRRAGIGFYGAIAGLAAYYFFFDLVWPHANPLISLYAPDRQLQVAHILWGVALGRSPGYAARIARTQHRPADPPSGEYQTEVQEPAEIVSSELIL